MTTDTTTEQRANDVHGADVLHMLREQSRLYDELEALARRQRTLVTDDDIGPLLSLLADRQKLSERLVLLGARLSPIRREWPRYRERFSSQEREEADRCLGEASAALQRVLDRDARDARILSGRKQSVAAALEQAQSTRQAISAYRGGTVSIGRLDCTDEGA